MVQGPVLRPDPGPERVLGRRLFRGHLRAQERVPLRWLLRWPQQRLERRLQRVVKRGLLKKEDLHLLRTLERLDEQRL
ncbi:hypothetical protein FJY68_10530 [candidate division WOR-3 bacterium]|uniref:Uncharacterized protein n=1 Tax=candidate division WOR-3 bacterium TaxID=2052148 RepID=A0A938BU29_UNCW3|nr:hypothetical protein [candidate division WOR-3 bacterium]